MPSPLLLRVQKAMRPGHLWLLARGQLGRVDLALHAARRLPLLRLLPLRLAVYLSSLR